MLQPKMWAGQLQKQSNFFNILPNNDRQSDVDAKTSSCCCQTECESAVQIQTSIYPDIEPHFIRGYADTAAGKVPLVDTSLAIRDILGGWKARWGISRMNYKISPGLYGVGQPNDASPVLVTANYKMTFDRLRKELSGIDAWIMVLDTKGINVWCAAGKGTFGTAEIVKRINMVNLFKIVSHRTLVLPQLGAPGVAAHEVKRQTGFKVVYGPVKARHIREFLEAGMKAKKEMRIVEFNFFDRIFLIPIELVGLIKRLLVIGIAVFISHTIGLVRVTFLDLYPFFGAVLVGAVVAPALLPWIPGRAFSLKGWIAGVLWACAVIYQKGGFSLYVDVLNNLALLLVLPAISAFLTFNFTGSSTYTSPSGVKREMKCAMPAIIISASAGIVLWLVGLLI